MTTIGQKLKEAREDQRLTLDKVFEDTRIRVQYLQALEADDLSVMPSPVQARGYLRNYVEYLGLSIENVLNEMRETNAQKPSDQVIGPADVPDSQPTDEPEMQAPAVDTPVQELSPLTKPRPVRRKKVESQPVDASAPTPTKRRGRKKVEPDDLVVESEATLAIDVAAQSETNPEQVVELSAPEPEPIADIVEPDIPMVESPQFVAPQPVSDVNDSLWQSWLNRLSSVLAARNKRPTLVQNQEVISEIQAEPAIITEAPVVVPVDENLSQEGSTQIFKEIGRELRKRRELLSLHLEEVERNTHVKAHYLDALERGAMDDLPSTVQTRGMLSNYATFLDLDVDTLLLRFADALQTRHRERNPQIA